MAIQSRAPVILLTRPQAQSGRFAADLRLRFPGIMVIQSPLMVRKFLAPAIPDRAWRAAIFTSETAVLSARRIFADLTAPPTSAFCVGNHTAQIAQNSGFSTLSAEGDALALIALIKASSNTGPLLYLHGRDVRTDIGNQLDSAGIETFSVISYDQVAQPLSDEATDILHAAGPVVVPIFSPRTGALFASECDRVLVTAPLSIVAISKASAAPFPSYDVTTAEKLTALAMMDAITLRLTSLLNP